MLVQFQIWLYMALVEDAAMLKRDAVVNICEGF